MLKLSIAIRIRRAFQSHGVCLQAIALMRKILIKLRGFKRKIVRTLSNADVEELKRGFQEASELGKDSSNQWIKRSSKIPGYLFLGEHEFILHKAGSAPAGDFVEIGVWFGKSTSLLAGAVVDRNRNEKVFSFHPFTNEGEERDRKNHAILHGLKMCFQHLWKMR